MVFSYGFGCSVLYGFSQHRDTLCFGLKPYEDTRKNLLLGYGGMVYGLQNSSSHRVLAPIDVFSRTQWKQEKLKDLHVWGSPIYILDKTIADGKKLPHWKPRSKRCKYLGVSPTHASTVPLVWNPDTGAITPQFHCISDSWFHTVTSEIDDLPDFDSDDWQKLFGDFHYRFMFEEDDLQVMRECER